MFDIFLHCKISMF